jgi:hypothetical protein
MQRNNIPLPMRFHTDFQRKFSDIILRDLISCIGALISAYAGISKSFRTARLERELQMAQHSAIRCSCIAIL